MPKEKAELTPKQKAASDARVKLEAAEDAHGKKPSPATEQAVNTARALVASTAKEVRRESYIRVGGSRVRKAAIALRNVGGVSTTRSYDYSEGDVTKWYDHLAKLLTDAKEKQLEGLRTRSAAPAAKDDFSF